MGKIELHISSFVKQLKMCTRSTRITRIKSSIRGVELVAIQIALRVYENKYGNRTVKVMCLAALFDFIIKDPLLMKRLFLLIKAVEQ